MTRAKKIHFENKYNTDPIKTPIRIQNTSHRSSNVHTGIQRFQLPRINCIYKGTHVAI